MEENLSASIYELLRGEHSPALAEYIETQREEMGISQRKFCLAAGIHRRSYQRILQGEAQTIDVITFLKIAQFFNIDVEGLLKIYVAGIEPEEVGGLERARRAGFLLRHFDLVRLRKEGFIENISDYDAIEERIIRFFGHASIFEYARPVAATLFSRTARPASDKMLDFWLRAVQTQVSQIKGGHPFNREYVTKIVPRLRALTCDEERGFLLIVRELYKAGVTVLVESYLGSTQIRGGTFIVKDRVFIVLTDFNKRYDTLWFSLGHELYHTLKDQDLIRDKGYHLSGDPTLFTSQLSEDLADHFAGELLLPDKMLRIVKEYMDIPALVQSKARDWGVHEKVIYGRYLATYGKDEYHKYRKKTALNPITLRNVLLHPWDKETLDETVTQVETLFA